ncbi:cellulose biosynthesis cyclic di-GMP-binding regulatory protein BcsB [Alcaligenaceae bacterium]|nr:cellulose biosynthesis cyclic di-GMP-binding regulatory protein BcsB [Alcaligenaceae bacterium]
MCFAGLALSCSAAVAQVATNIPAAPASEESEQARSDIRARAPQQSYRVMLAELAQGDSFQLQGVRNTQELQFTLRRDQLVESASLNLVFTPSPALLPRLSHLRVYLNDEMMGVVPVESANPGQQLSHAVPLDARLMTSFNRVRLEFVGHYTDICEDLTHTSLWLDVSRKTHIAINQQALATTNDLSFFPEPFFDARDMKPQEVPFVFSSAPGTQGLRAAGILASYFGSQAKWRTIRFPAHYNKLPTQHAIVFAANDARPDLLKSYPQVQGPTVDLISHPDNPYFKLLLVLGRNDEDLVAAASALAVGGPLFRGQSVSVDEVLELAPREPYDAPNWTPTDRPVLFSELADYPGQLEVSGLRPHPITLNLNLPPDLFVWRNNGIPLQILYRYSPPKTSDESRLTLSLNDRFVDSYNLHAGNDKGVLTRMRLPLLGNDRSADNENLLIPALKIGAHNSIRFDFAFASTIGSSQRDMCQTILPVDVRASIDERSVIDFSGFHHYLEMPNLRAFAGSGFPFSRMADLSETVVVMPTQPTAAQTTILLETLAHVGAQVGYPALKMKIQNDWNQASELDADILLIGDMPDAMRSRPDANLLLQGTQASLRQPRNPDAKGSAEYGLVERKAQSGREPLSQVGVRALAPIAAIVGMQSERFPQRSVVGLLASTDEDFTLLREAIGDSGKREAMSGSVVIVRESGVASETVGPHYYVGHLRWWQLLWFHLSDKPVLLAGVAFLAVLLISFLLWNGLRWVARRRLDQDV